MDRAWEGIRGAASDRRSGAAEIARRAAEALAALPRADLRAAVEALVRGHPSMAPLWRLGTEVLAARDHAGAAAAFARRVGAEADAVAAAAAPLLDGTIVLHSYSSTLVAAVAAAGVAAHCARSEPGGEGEATAAALRERGVDAWVVSDKEAEARAASGMTVVVGADSVGPGGVVNKVRTAALATASRRGGGRCLALSGSTKLVAEDLPAGPPFERVPLDRLTAIVTEDGTLAPGEARRAAAAHVLHPVLRDLLRSFG
jgi:translation initiation factor 2B subunit (eIF-2B alpha/beta/delta family)